MIDDEDKAAARRDHRRARDVRFARPAMIIIEGCIDSEHDSVAKMAMRHLRNSKFDTDELLINYGICDPDKLGDEGYHVIDDIHAAILGAFIAGYNTAFMGEEK